LKITEEAELSSTKIFGGVGAKGWRIGSLLVILGTVALSSSSAFAQTTPVASTSAKPKTTKPRTPAPDSAASATPVKTFGNKNAPITMEVFSDYQCPSCGNFYEQTLKPLLGPDGYVASGKVYLVHRDFPLEMHPYSAIAARWANAAAKIGKFQDVDAALWDNQSSWSTDGNIEKFVAAAMSSADFKRLQALLKACTGTAPKSKADRSVPAADPGCSVDPFIVQDIGLGYSVPVQATPTFVIYYKGQKYPASSGMVSYPILKQFFDSLLSQ
jgi:protein-disulfide isomerase